MSREEIQKLLGGYATDTLSETERRALFEAALEDQELFDALAKEQALRDVLQDPLARQQLIAALEPEREPLRMRAWRWLRQPAGLAVAAGLAALLIVTGVVWRRSSPPVRREVLVAQVKPQAPAAPPEPTVAPVKEFQRPAPKRKLVRPAPSPESSGLSTQRQMAKTMPAAAPPAPAAPPPAAADTITAEARVVREQTGTAKESMAAGRAGSSAKGAATTSAAPAAPAPAPPPPAPLVANATAPATSVDLARQLYSQPSKQTLASGRSSAMHTPALQRDGATPLARNLGVRYGLLRKGTDDEYSPVTLDTVFHSGDAVRLRVEPNDTGYVYLFQRDATGGWRLASTQRVEKGQRCLLPASGALQYDQPGSKELLLVLSRQEEPSLAGLDTAELDALASNARTNILKATVSSEESGYAVDTRAQASQQKVAFEITLEYR